MNFIKITSLLSILGCIYTTSANALEYSLGRSTVKLTGYGTIGTIQPDFENPLFINDWRVRGQFNYDIGSDNTMGAVYSIDALTIDSDKFARDAFMFLEWSGVGRLEVGLTDSIARKLGIALPDVSGLRVTDKPLFYKKINPSGAAISDTELSSGRDNLRINLVSIPTRPVQYGVSFAGLTNNYNYATDFGIKIRRPEGKTKTAFAFGASFIDSPENYNADIYAPKVTADWRAQASASMSLQYNSWIVGLSARAIYDENKIGPSSDGIIVGTGISYDVLKYSLSATYLLSDTGVWDDTKDHLIHNAILSFRYKYSENVDMWMSTGITTDTPFFSAGVRLTF